MLANVEQLNEDVTILNQSMRQLEKNLVRQCLPHVCEQFWTVIWHFLFINPHLELHHHAVQIGSVQLRAADERRASELAGADSPYHHLNLCTIVHLD